MSKENEAMPIAKTLDCKGDLCPMPVYKASQTIAKLADGEVLEIICTDKGSIKDFPAFCKQTGHDLIRTDVGDRVQTFFIRKQRKLQ